MPPVPNRPLPPKAPNRPLPPKAGPEPGPGQSSPTPTSPETGSSPTSPADDQTRGITMTIPTDKIFSTAADIVMTPVALARQVLPAKGGLPLYAGLGALAAVGIIEWPVAVAAGAGYALARYWTPHEPDKERPAEHPLTG